MSSATVLPSPTKPKPKKRPARPSSKRFSMNCLCHRSAPSRLNGERAPRVAGPRIDFLNELGGSPSPPLEERDGERRPFLLCCLSAGGRKYDDVTQVSKPAVSPTSQSADRPLSGRFRIWKSARQQVWKPALQNTSPNWRTGALAQPATKYAKNSQMRAAACTSCFYT